MATGRALSRPALRSQAFRRPYPLCACLSLSLMRHRRSLSWPVFFKHKTQVEKLFRIQGMGHVVLYRIEKYGIDAD